MIATAPAAESTGSLSERAMLVDLRISRWDGIKTDKRISRDTAANHGADSKMLRVRKELFNREATETASLRKIAQNARDDHKKFTLPWGDNKQRILSSAAYFDWTQTMQQHQSAWQSALPVFLSAYARLRDDARLSLGSAWSVNDYPPDYVVARKFDFGYSVSALPDASDFRVSLGDAETERIKRQISADTQTALRDTLSDVGRRVKSVLVGEDIGNTHIPGLIEKLAGYTGGRTGKFNDSVISNVRELVAILPMLNIAQSAELTALTARLETEICSVDPEILRVSESSREATMRAAESIIADMSAFI